MKPFLYIAFLFWCSGLTAQESQFSQFFASSAYLNPGFVGLQPSTSLTVNYKFGFSDQEGDLQELTHVSFIQPINRVTTFVTQSAGVGLTFVQEKSGYQGIYQTTNMLLSGSYVIRFDYEGKYLLSFGLQGGVIQNRLNTDDLKYGSQYNPYIGYDDTLPTESLRSDTHMAPTFNYGMVFSGTDHHNPLLSQNSMLLGLSIHSINRPSEGFISNAKSPVQLKLIATASRRLGVNYFIHPSAYIYSVRGSHQLNGGMYLSRYVDRQLRCMLQLGTWYRVNDSFIFLAGIKYNQWKMGVSLDLNAKSINSNEVTNIQGFQPTFELSLAFNLNFKDTLVGVTNPLF